MNWGQLAELIFLFFATTIMLRLGVKKAMAIGLAALVARYLSFYLGVTANAYSYYIIGILFHGLIFGLFFVGGQVYTDKKAPAGLRTQAQGMLSFLIWGVALLFGNFICSKLIAVNTTIDASGAKVYDWTMIFGITTLYSAAVLVLFLIFFKDKNVNKS
jgi:MFS family permease